MNVHMIQEVNKKGEICCYRLLLSTCCTQQSVEFLNDDHVLIAFCIYSRFVVCDNLVE